MSGYTMTQTELLHAFYGPATISVVTATTNVTITAAQPEIAVPANYFTTLGKHSSSLVLELGGYITATTTPPTWQWGVGYQIATSAPAFTAANPVCTATAAVAASTGASGSWTLRLSMGLRTLGTGAASTLWCSGRVDCNLFSAAPLLLNPAGSGGTTVTAWQSDAEYYLWPYIQLSAATAGNQVTTQYAKLYGEN